MPDHLAKMLILIGIVFIVSGMAVWLIAGHTSTMRLPGDINITKGPVKISFPLGLSIAISLILTVILNIVLFISKK